MNGVVKSNFEYSATALKVPAGMNYDEFCQSLRTHEFLSESINWWLGDLLVMGTKAYGEDRVVQAISATRKKPDTLDSYRNVAERIEPARRRSELSWSAHREVCMLEPDEQDKKLSDAVEHHLSSRQLRKLVKGELFIEENGNVTESADRDVPQEPAPDQPTANETSSTSTDLPTDPEARIEQARTELNDLLNKVQLYLTILGGSFGDEISRMRQYGE